MLEHEVTPHGASLSPDGQYLVYDAPGSNGRRDVFIASTDGGAPAVLTTSAADDVSPMWTSDGTHVIFTSDRTGATTLWGIDVADGKAAGPPRMLFHDSGVMAGSLGLTADGTFYYVRQTGLVNVYRVELDAAGKPLTQPEVATERYFGTNMGAAWGPDGALAHSTRVGQTLTEHLAIRDPERGLERLLDTRMLFLRLIRWSPDGREILVKGRDGAQRFGLHLVDPQTGRTTPVVIVPLAAETSIGQVGWSHETSTVLYVKDGELIARGLANGEERTLTQVAPAGSVIGFDTLQSAGTIVYVEQRRGNAGLEWTLHLLEADGSSRVLVGPAKDDRFFWPSWMPDGRAILVVRPVAGASGESEICRIDRATGESTRLGISMGGLRNIDVSDDGRAVTFTAGTPTREIWVLEHFLPPQQVPTPAR
ncbi:MAG TPA: hypothetical protein VMO26_22210, partial [Vicinamibacterales bacterium]|nr:hypothetical protein [Vicinamibacterales bacterium]